jgi:hypothetical protein
MTLLPHTLNRVGKELFGTVNLDSLHYEHA